MQSGFMPYDPLRRFIAEYFGNPLLQNVGETKNGLSIFVAIVLSNNIMAQRYIMATTIKTQNQKKYLSDIDWNTFQTRSGSISYDAPEFSYDIPMQTPLKENSMELMFSGVNDDKNTYVSQKLRCQVIIRTGNRTYNNLSNIANALETYSCLLVHL